MLPEVAVAMMCVNVLFIRISCRYSRCLGSLEMAGFYAVQYVLVNSFIDSYLLRLGLEGSS